MTRKEIIQSMLNGDKVAKISWLGDASPIKYIEYDPNAIMTMVYKDGATQPYSEVFANPQEWEIYTEPEWYDNIPSQGTICHVDNDMIDIIYSYNRSTRRFSSLSKTYASANPMIPAEIELLYITQQ
jgi:hypothetical protein